MRDPIVEEVRKYRMEHSQKFGGNLAAIRADLRSVQEASGHEVARLPAKRVEPDETAGAERRGVQ